MSSEATEIGRFEFGPNGKVIRAKSDQPVTYYKRRVLLWTWAACSVTNDKGCVAVRQARLLMDRAPPSPRLPPLATSSQAATQPSKTASKMKSTRAERDVEFFSKLLDAEDAVRNWWTKPLAPLPSPRTTDAVTAPTAVAQPVIPPFDLQDIPTVMDKIGLPVSARMARHWFAGPYNYSLTSKDATAGIDQNGQPFTANMIDHSIIALDWVLGFPRAAKAYDKLLAMIDSDAARGAVRRNLVLRFASSLPIGEGFDAMAASDGDIHQLHANFQFQLSQVDSTWQEKLALWIKDQMGLAHAPDDLTGALGTFSIYAAIGNVRVDLTRRRASVRSVHIYVRDSYSFLDENDESVAARLGASQYLGHWNAEGVYMAPIPLQGDSKALRWISVPLVDINKSIFDKGAVMYPITNQSFRDWRQAHAQGGDFIAYSNVRKIWLKTPIVVNL